MAFRVTRQRRYNRYIANGFITSEAFSLSKVPYRRTPLIKVMIRDRRDLLRPLRHQADQLGWGKARYEKEKRLLIAWDYGEKRFPGENGLPFEPKDLDSVWRLFRWYTETSEDGYDPRSRRRHRRRRFGENGIRIDKGNVRLQKEKRRAKQRAKKQRRSEGASY